MTKLPVGVNDFEKIRNEGYVYVDKTPYIFELATTGFCYQFVSPAHTGKTLLLSTLKAYFEGRRELFRGLEIEKLEREWTCHPVMHFDLSGYDYKKEGALYAALDSQLKRYEDIYGRKYPEETDLSIRFMGVLKLAHKRTGQEVAVLVDDFTRPLLDVAGDEKLLHDNWRELDGFYCVLKSLQDHICFEFLTGDAVYVAPSIFSGANHLDNISLDYDGMCGISEEEVHRYFDGQIRELASAEGITFDEACGKLRDTFGGYHYTDSNTDSPGMYEPLGLLEALDGRQIRSKLTGGSLSEYAVEDMRKWYDPERLQNLSVKEHSFINRVGGRPDALQELYHQGYLTIKEESSGFGSYIILGFPNKAAAEYFSRAFAD